nr:hypothetical protein GCM10020093_034740 [Planobispora longispora]
MQAQVLEAERQQQPDQVGADAPAPVIGAQAQADLGAVRVVGLDVQPGDADDLPALPLGDREHVEPPGFASAAPTASATICSTSSRVRGSNGRCSVAVGSP